MGCYSEWFPTAQSRGVEFRYNAVQWYLLSSLSPLSEIIKQNANDDRHGQPLRRPPRLQKPNQRPRRRCRHNLPLHRPCCNPRRPILRPKSLLGPPNAHLPPDPDRRTRYRCLYTRLVCGRSCAQPYESASWDWNRYLCAGSYSSNWRMVGA